MEETLAENILEVFKANTKFDCQWIDKGRQKDAFLEFTINGKVLRFRAEVKKRVQHVPVGRAEGFFPLLLLAQHIPPAIRQGLRENRIAYIEESGNAYLNHNGVFVWIEGMKALVVKKETGNRAFTKTGLKVLFQLWQNPELVNEPQRIIAEKTGVALGNIPQVIEGLTKFKFLLPYTKGKYVWDNRRGLLDKFIENYALVLKPKLALGRYTCKSDWRTLPLKATTVWGGEPAGELLTNYLRAEKLTLYTKESRNELIRNYRIVPDAKGEIYVYEAFWEVEQFKTAPPLIVYADLVLEGGKRNTETAQMIYHEFIEPNL